MTDSNQHAPPDLGLAPETLTAQALGKVDQKTQSLIPPIYPSTAFQRDADGEYRTGRGYTRPHNPSYDEPESLLAKLEGGADCLLFASGMAAANAVFQSLLPGDHVIAPRIMYWALRKWLIESAMTWSLDIEFLDTCDLQQLQAAIRPGKTRLVWLETPANPTWDITDIAKAATITHHGGARLAVDSTVAPPVITRAIEHGADLVMHSATKYLNGHSDVLAGALICREPDAFWNRIKAWRRDAGAVLGPFEAWLLLRGMRTLFVRVNRCSKSALTIATHFRHHRKVRQVLYPGLPEHPGHAEAVRQMTQGFGGMLSIRLNQGRSGAIETAARVLVFKRATSLGGVESLIEHRASIEGPGTPVPDDLLRLSIGLEDPSDLIADLEQALEHDICDPRPIAASTPGFDLTFSKGTLAERIQALLATRLVPVATERGGEFELASIEHNTVRVRLSGSPGALLPLKSHISEMLSHYISPDLDLELVCYDPANTSAPLAPQSMQARVAQLLAEQINPAVATHRGEIKLSRVENGTVYVRLEGGCQGCAMADVTLRQGVEPLLKEQIPEIVSLVDETNHSEGRQPFFKTKKG